MSEGLFQLKSDYRQSDGLDELRAEAWIYGFKLEFIIDPDATPEEAARGSTSLPEQAEEILYELLTKHYLRLCEALNAERRARGQKPIGDPAKLAKQKADFEKAYYGRLRHSEKGRRAVDALRAWRGAQIAQQRGYQVTDSSRIAEMEPFLHAVRTLDVEFFKLLAQATQMLDTLDTRIRAAKNASIRTGDTYLDMQLLIYGMRIAGTPTHTAEELNNQFVSKFRAMTDKELQERLHELGVPYKHKPRGKASPDYGFKKGWDELKARLNQK